jgi:plastocyanin
MMGAAVTALALAGAAACSNSSSPAASSAGSASATVPATGGGQSASADKITIAGFAFTTPSSVAPGASITVTNQDSVEHTVTADSAGGFSVTVPAGGTATFTAPSAAGSYPFHCSVHPSMHGTLVVSASSG